jgi:hypothetical protein
MAVYRWDFIQEENGCSCLEVQFPGAITREKITECVMAALYGNGYEQKLINDYNAAKAGLLGPEYEQPYLDFLSQRKLIKEEIYAAIQ